MKQAYRHLLSAVVVTMALAISLPTAVGAKSQGHGKEGRGGSSEARGGHSRNREVHRGGGSRSSGERGYARREVNRGGDWQGSGPRRALRDREPRSDRRGDVRYRDPGSDRRGDVRYRDPGSDRRGDVRYRDSDGRDYAPSYRSQPSYRHSDRSHSAYRSRSYYTGSFHRPRFVYRSGFSIGFVIGSVPSYGYRYFDPYCDMGFSDLDIYYGHCHDYGHPDMIQVLDIRFGYPIASSVYRGGDWVVDDCY